MESHELNGDSSDEPKLNESAEASRRSNIHPQPECVQILTRLLLVEDPKPLELSIAILRADEGGDRSLCPSVSFQKADVHLGVHAPDLPRLAQEFRKDYYSLRETFAKEYSKETSGTYAQDRNRGHEPRIDLPVLRHRILDATTCLLITCPDNATAWADRRRAFLLDPAVGGDKGFPSRGLAASIFMSELDFLDLLFTQHSKAPNSWAHRKWICKKIIAESATPNHAKAAKYPDQYTLVQAWARHEIDICTRVAERFPKNYYAWEHRCYVISSLTDHWFHDCNNGMSKASAGESLRTLLDEEIAFIEIWLRSHVSDHSAAHYGTEALRYHLKHGFRYGSVVLRESECSAMESALEVGDKVLAIARTLIKKYTSHEVIWCWLRHCGEVYFDIMDGEFGSKRASTPQVVSALNGFIRQHIIGVFEAIVDGSHADNGVLLEEREIHRSKICGLTYIMWILDQLKRRKFLIQYVQNKDQIDLIHHKAKQMLKEDENIPYNTWRFNKLP